MCPRGDQHRAMHPSLWDMCLRWSSAGKNATDTPDPAASFNKEGKSYFLVVVAVAKEVVLKTYVKGIVTSTFISGLGLVRYIIYHLKRKIRAKKKRLSPDVYGTRLKAVTSLWRINEPTLCFHNCILNVTIVIRGVQGRNKQPHLFMFCVFILFIICLSLELYKLIFFSIFV